MKFVSKCFALILSWLCASGSSLAADTVKVAFIGPLSGPFALIGETQLADLTFAMDTRVNAKGGVAGKKVEIVKFDDQMNPKEATAQIDRAIKENIQYVFGGSNSATAGLINAAIKKHNKRNTNKQVLFIDYNAIDPALTNDDCHFMHFALDSHVGQKMKALVASLVANKKLKKVYIIGQDYAFGRAFSKLARDMLKKADPSIEIVGDEFHPLGQVTDFSPYVAKIVKSGADAVMTGNFGPDMVRLAKAMVGAGFKNPVYTFYAATFGTTKALGKDAVGIVHVAHSGRPNPVPDAFLAYRAEFRKKYPNLDGAVARFIDGVDIWSAAYSKAAQENTKGEVDPVRVAKFMSGAEINRIDGDKVQLRAKDHLLIQPVYVSVHSDANKPNHFDFDSSGFGLELVHTLTLADAALETTCKMEIPEAAKL